MKMPQRCCVVLLSLFSLLTSRVPVHGADEYLGSLFAGGGIYSEIVVQDHLVVVPFPNVHGPLGFGSIDSWLLRWKIADLKTNQPNFPEKVVYLAHQKRTGEITYGFRANAYTNLAVCNLDNVLELYVVGPKKQPALSKTILTVPPANETTPPADRVFSRSEQYFFLWKPTPTIYAMSNFSVVKQIKMTTTFTNFEADSREDAGYLHWLTDDLKYLIFIPLEFGGPFNQRTIVDSPHCLNLETGEYTKWKINAGTNQTLIVDAESIAGSPTFIAYWEASGSRHLGILDRDAQIVAELPTQGTTDTQFWRNTAWDYANSRFLVHEPGDKLTIYDYRAKVAQHFFLPNAKLRTP